VRGYGPDSLVKPLFRRRAALAISKGFLLHPNNTQTGTVPILTFVLSHIRPFSGTYPSSLKGLSPKLGMETRQMAGGPSLTKISDTDNFVRHADKKISEISA
jgi:hypothetical protein